MPMKNISLRKTIDFQECFYHDGKFSPFELAQDYKIFYPLAIIGEIGSLINNKCKSIRSQHSYAENIVNDCADIFIYLMLFGRMLEKHEKFSIFDDIESKWETPEKEIKSEKDFCKHISLLNEKIATFFTEDTKLYTSDFFGSIFSIIKDISFYLTSSHWQEIINKFHISTLEEFSQINKYTPDKWYAGSCYVDFDKLVNFIESSEIQIPKKRILFFKRLSQK
jgi:hypothetical protein